MTHHHQILPHRIPPQLLPNRRKPPSDKHSCEYFAPDDVEDLKYIFVAANEWITYRVHYM